LLFNSLQFIGFFCVVLGVLFILPKKSQPIWLIVVSLYFYASWNLSYVFLIILTAVSSYFAGRVICTSQSYSFRRLWFFVTLTLNFGILILFKYFNFFAETINNTLLFTRIEFQISYVDFLLPVGISFYTFQAASYLFDVYNGKVLPEKNARTFVLFIFFFPQLVAGPIERASKLLPQFQQHFRFNYGNILVGLTMMLYGFFKKLVIADRLGMYVNLIYNNYDSATSAQLVVAIFFFSFQIYCDFSGYTNIAIGCAKMMGINLSENFSRPYFAVSIQDFWRRWHITLSNWFKDYLYIPLGGNRGSKFRKMFNILFVFLVCGLWHGANWTFVAWGGVHGLLLAVNHLLLKIDRKRIILRIPLVFRIVGVFLIVSFAWVFFRAPTLVSAAAVISGVFSSTPDFTTVLDNVNFSIWEFKLCIAGITALMLFESLLGDKSLEEFLNHQGRIVRWSLYYGWIFSILLFGVFGVNEFIYFQF
jgi:alginate O-acetyltransferase complex protein AlgI